MKTIIPPPLREPLLLAGTDLEDPLCFTMSGGIVAAYTRGSPRKPGGNEDAAALIPVSGHSCVLAVADGLGGQPEGASAARRAVEALAEAVRGAPAGDALREAVLEGIERANRRILSVMNGSATTLTAAVLEGGELRDYHVGDSMLLVTGQRGRLKHQTVAQSPVGVAQAMGVLSEQEAMFHPHRNLVSNVVGSLDLQIAVGNPVRLAPRDTLLLATDGLMDNLYNEEIVEAVRSGTLQAGARELLEHCRGRMKGAVHGDPCKPDDLTFVLFRRG